MSRIEFVFGLTLSVVVALMMFCQERCFVGVNLGFWPMVAAIFGIGLIAASKLRPMRLMSG
jgi:hypothetical protein